jgi:Brp/Blh family beta-carotene 15,15'-monooxygenase
MVAAQAADARRGAQELEGGMSSVSLSLRPVHSVSHILLPQRLTLFAGVALACCAATAAHLMSGPAVLPLATAAIAIAMWHGAYDQVQAEHMLAGPLGRRWLPIFLTGYAALGALTFLGWRIAPFVSLILFLLYAAWHFGSEAEQRTPAPPAALAALALGAAPIVAACRWHGDEVTPIFAAMIAGQRLHAETLTHVLSTVCWPVLAVAALGIVLGRHDLAQRVEMLAVLLIQIALFAICDPLIAFAVYFCCWHTPEHLLATSLPPASLGRNLKAGLVPWLLSLVLLAVCFALGRREATAYRAEIFILLSALTVPHMALNELRRFEFSGVTGKDHP